jgi:hypothetical protein
MLQRQSALADAGTVDGAVAGALGPTRARLCIRCRFHASKAF